MTIPPPPDTPAPILALVVEDDPLGARITQAFLRVADVSFHSVRGGEDAISAIQSYDYDIVLMDIVMPEMSGVEATERIRKLNGPVGRIPIIAVTARVTPDEQVKYLAAGMNSVMAKPIDRERLIEVMRALVATYRSLKAARP